MLSPQITPSRWSCLPTAFAIVLDLPVAQVITEIGHDGSFCPVPFKGLPEPFCRQAFHIQELIDVSITHGYAVTAIEALPYSEPKSGYGFLPWLHDNAEDRFVRHLVGRQGVLTGMAESGMPHAIAWDQTIGLDPKDGRHIRLHNFSPQTFYWVTRIGQSNPE